MVRPAAPSVRPARWRLVLGPLTAAGLMLAACGGDDSSGSAATTTVGAPTAEQSAPGAAAATEPAPAPGDGKVAAGDSTMAALPVEYVYEGDLPPLDGPAGAWRWDPRQTPTVEQIAALAGALGVEGDVSEQPADMGGGWVVGAEGSPRLTVAADAQGSWSLIAASPPTCTDGVATSVGVAPAPADPGATPASEPAATDGTAGLPAAPPETVAPPDTVVCAEPVGIPTADEARAKAVELLQALGLDPDGYAITADSQEWGAWADARLLLDGIAAPVVTSFGFGADGALTYASGQLSTPEPAGQYERTGTSAALERLQADPFGGYGPAIDPAATGPEPRPATEPTGADTPVGTPESAPPIVDSGNPTDTADTAPAQPVTVVLTGVEPAWWPIWADDGTVWLLPGYDFITDQDEHIAAPAVAQIDMPVVETMTGPAEPAPGAGEPAAEPDLAPPLGN